jgi:hypothetical protein
MPKSDAVGGIKSGRRFACSPNIARAPQSRRHPEKRVSEVLLDAWRGAFEGRSRSPGVADVGASRGHRPALRPRKDDRRRRDRRHQPSSIKTRMFYARRQLAELPRAQGIASAAA